MYSLISTKNMIIDKIIAIEMLGYNTYEHQRGIRPAHVKELAEKMRAGQYNGGQVVFGINGKGQHVVDGQHTLTAVVASGIPIQAIVKKVDCPTSEDLAHLWQQYDGGIPRGLADYVRSEIGALDIGWSSQFGALIAGAAVIVTHGITRRQITKSEKIKLIKDYLTDGAFVRDIAGETFSSAMHMKRQAVVAVMILSYRISEQDAYLFWTKVKTGEMLEKTDPEYHLRNFLITSAIRGVSLTKIANPREFYVRSVKAWNCFREGKRMSLLRYSFDGHIPKLK